jgi:pimeloyl-ACP methyl ester carboxylesterase
MRALLFLVGLGLAAAGVLLVQLDLPAGEVAAKYSNRDSRFAEVQGMQVHYRDRGDGPTVLLLHGSNASLHTWEGWVAGLRDGHRVVTVDLPGHGLTGPRPDDDGRGYAVPELVDFLHAFVGVVDLERFTIGGNSMGGWVAWQYVLRHPDRVERLILVDAGGYPMEPPDALGFRILMTPGLREITRWVSPRAVFEQSIADSYGDPSRITPELVDRYWELNLREGNRGATIARFAEPFAYDEASRIPAIRVPTLVLWGAEDRLLPRIYADQFGRDIPGAVVRVYPGLGHVPMEEAPERTLPDVQAFLAAAPAS